MWWKRPMLFERQKLLPISSQIWLKICLRLKPRTSYQFWIVSLLGSVKRFLINSTKLPLIACVAWWRLLKKPNLALTEKFVAWNRALKAVICQIWEWMRLAPRNHPQQMIWAVIMRQCPPIKIIHLRRTSFQNYRVKVKMILVLRVARKRKALNAVVRWLRRIWLKKISLMLLKANQNRLLISIRIRVSILIWTFIIFRCSMVVQLDWLAILK